MKKHIITKEQLSESGEYIGPDLSAFDGHIEAEKNLGDVRFAQTVSAAGYIYFKAGSGIEAGWGIEAGEGIEAGRGIKAGSGIEAEWGIKAGSGIKAGEGIKAGGGIEAGLSIVCKWIYGLRIFAGLCLWKIPLQEEMEIRCGEVKKGVICFGNLVKTGAEKK